MQHPCLRCGACCAFFRVAFHWSEGEASLGGCVPPELTEKLDPHRLAMRGTDAAQPRCVALQGTVGGAAHCGIYAQRPSVCREVKPSWEFGVISPQCDKARVAHGMPPLTMQDWMGPPAFGDLERPLNAVMPAKAEELHNSETGQSSDVVFRGSEVAGSRLSSG